MKLARHKEKRTYVCLLAAAIVVAALAAPVGAQPIPLKANECNARIDISLGATSIAPGAVVGVTLTHTNTDSQDNGNNPIGQTLTQMNFTPACMTAGMGGGCMTPAMGVATVDLMSLAGTCSGATGVDNGNGTYTFMFGPPPGAPIGNPMANCNITFNVMVAATFMGMSIDMFADTQATCNNPLNPPPPANPIFTAGDSDSATLMVAPTLGEAALMALALVLLLGAWAILRRRSAGGPAAA